MVNRVHRYQPIHDVVTERQRGHIADDANRMVAEALLGLEQAGDGKVDTNSFFVLIRITDVLGNLYGARSGIEQIFTAGQMTIDASMTTPTIKRRQLAHILKCQ